MINQLHKLSRKNKQAIILVIDVLIVMLSLWIAYSLRMAELFAFIEPSDTPQHHMGNVSWMWLIAPSTALPVFIYFRLYKVVIEHIESRTVLAIIQAVSVYTLLLGTIILLADIFWVPRSVLIIHWLVTLSLIISSRVIGKWLFTKNKKGGLFGKSSTLKNILIYGAGDAGVQLSTVLNYSSELHPVAFIDDRFDLSNSEIRGLQVYPASEIERLIAKHNIQEILIAIPSASKGRIRYLVSMMEQYPVKLRILPSVSDLAEGKIQIEDIRDVNIDDLLGRDAVQPDEELLAANITGKAVMVTGAGGSIGSELCRQIIKHSPTLLVLYEQSEYSLYALEQELGGNEYDIECVPVLGSIMDQSRVEEVCRRFGIKTIYHAAAYKHVPLVEKNPVVGVINNVIGTYHTVKAATNTGVETFILISTDKAVRPTNIMGASKRFAELVLQGVERQGNGSKKGTRCIMVRFGNVLGSSGSVVPYFKQQIREGGPVTVTHKEITRYFMTIPEAAQLVIQAGAMGEGGDVFVLDMGKPVKIYDLAEHMIRLSGFEPKDEDNPDGDIEIKVTGLRPGEKLYEELLIGDNVLPTNHELIMRAQEESIAWPELEAHLDNLYSMKDRPDTEKLRQLLLEVVKGYVPQCGIVDVLAYDDTANKEDAAA